MIDEVVIEWLYDLKHYIRYDEQAEALDIAIERIHKQIPKKPIYTFIDGFTLSVPYYCPVCGEQIAKYDTYARCVLKEHHCQCGQAIDWEVK